MTSFRPLNTSNSTNQNYGQVNDMVRQINKEQQVKTFNGTNGDPALTIGKYKSSKYGLVGSDDDGFRRILVGQHPTDGHPGIWVSIEGIDVIDELST